MTDKPKLYRYKLNHIWHIVQHDEGCYRLASDNSSGNRLVTEEEFKRDYEPVEEVEGDGWMPIDGNTPRQKYILLYSAVGFWSHFETITVGTYENWHMTATHWRLLPLPPQSAKTEVK